MTIRLLGTTLLALAIACSAFDPPDEGGRAGTGQCPAPLSYEEVKERCNEAFTECLETHVQSKPGGLWGHSRCIDCRDECMRQKGIWPQRLLTGKPCL